MHYKLVARVCVCHYHDHAHVHGISNNSLHYRSLRDEPAQIALTAPYTIVARQLTCCLCSALHSSFARQQHHGSYSVGAKSWTTGIEGLGTRLRYCFRLLTT